MPSIKRSLAVLAAAPLLVFGLTACGGDGDAAPTDASVDEFCEVGDDFENAFDDIGREDYSALVTTAKDAADRMEEVGTPEDIPEDARAGFEAAVDAFGGLDAGELKDAMGELASAAESGEMPDEEQAMQDLFGLDKSDMKNIEALTEYTNKTC